MDDIRLSAADERRLARQIEAGLLAAAALEDRRQPTDPTPDLPPPVGLAAVAAQASAAELEALVEQGQRARRTMTLANIGLVRVIVRDCARPGTWSDLFQDGCLALEQAVMRFDYERGRLGPYAAVWIRQALRRRQPPAPSALPDELVDHGALAEIDARLTGHDLRSSLRRLPADERQVMVWRHGWEGEPASLPQIARRLDSTVAKVRRLERQALTRLRRQWRPLPAA
ncbi:MAG: sigma-70 family RNA polymerase sigma factor [Propionibacteriaceae bacterium]|jgi:RNA polymerase sigma factor (sigma-70 family)|nr:sigma-70 family RNA polymerase sigma factor [Propionibacteriaceae bacterium]